METTAMLTCPVCGGRATEVMPQDACLFFYTSPHCATQLRPRPGDCCVFCSYGDIQCPPKQAASSDTIDRGYNPAYP